MADPAQPLTEESFLADRMRIWNGFTTGTVIGVITVIVLLILLAFITL